MTDIQDLVKSENVTRLYDEYGDVCVGIICLVDSESEVEQLLKDKLTKADKLDELMNCHKDVNLVKTINDCYSCIKSQKYTKLKQALEEWYVCKYCNKAARLQSDFTKELADRIAQSCCGFSSQFSEKYMQFQKILDSFGDI